MAKLQTTSPQIKPIGDRIQPKLLIFIWTICPVVFIIVPGIVQTNNEQIIHDMAVVMAPANAKFNELSFTAIYTSFGLIPFS